MLHGVTQDLDEAASESNEDVEEETRHSEPDSTRPQDMPEFLVSTIDLAVTDVNFILTFRGKTPEEAAVFRVSLEASTLHSRGPRRLFEKPAGIAKLIGRNLVVLNMI